LIALGQLYFSGQQFKKAFKYFNTFYTKTSKKKKPYGTQGFDISLFHLGRIYELSPDMIDVKKSLHYYKILQEYCPESSLASEGLEREKYIRHHFLNIR
jgi:hypothetical protein